MDVLEKIRGMGRVGSVHQLNLGTLDDLLNALHDAGNEIERLRAAVSRKPIFNGDRPTPLHGRAVVIDSQGTAWLTDADAGTIQRLTAKE